MSIQRVFAFGMTAIAVAGWLAQVSAQCEPSWDVTLGNPGISAGYIQPMVAWNDGTGEKLYVGGSAENIGGNGLNDFLAQYDPVTDQWSRLGTGIATGGTNVFLTKLLPWDDGTGEKLYVVGQFGSAGGMASANSFAVWDGSNWSDVGAGFNQGVARVTYDMLPANLGDGEKLYLAGNWSEIGGVTVSGLAWYNGKSFGVWGTGDGIGIWGGFSPFVAALEMWDDGSGPAIYACGRFLGIDNASTRDVARYNVAEGKWESFGLPLLPTSVVNNMTSWAIFDDGTGDALYLGGQTFRVSGDPNVYVVAKWDGTTWTGVGQTLSGRVTDLQVWDDGNGPALYLSGTATFEVNYFAKLVGNTWVPAQNGVNNPPVEGNFSSAFGLYQWNNQLLVGGNFSQVGGLDPVTGVGKGTPIPARGLAALEFCGSQKNVVVADSFIAFRGQYLSGDLADTYESDDMYLKYRPGFTINSSEPPVWLIFDGSLSISDPTSLAITLEASTTTPGLLQSIEMFNWNSGEYELVDSRAAAFNTDSIVNVDLSGSISDFVQEGSGNIKARTGWRANGPVIVYPWTICIDQIVWTVGQ